MQLRRVDGTLIWEGDTEWLEDALEWMPDDTDLRGIDLNGICADCVYLDGRDLRGANLRGASIWAANLSRCDLRGATLPEGVPVVPNIDRAIRDAIRTGGKLEMGRWHGSRWDCECDAVHCRAGWAIHVAGGAGYALEAKVGACVAGALIYAASRPDKPVPDFFASAVSAMADIEACAAEQEGA